MNTKNVVLVALLSLSVLPFPLRAQTSPAVSPTPTPTAVASPSPAPAPFPDVWQSAIAAFRQGPLTNVVVAVGVNRNTTTGKWGGEAFLGYNIIIPDLPGQPYVIPMFGVLEADHRWYGVSGTVSLNKDIYPLRIFTASTNNVLYKVRLTLTGVAGVGTDISGQQFGPVKVPGSPSATGTGTAAITGAGAVLGLPTIGHVALSAFYERTKWTTMTGELDMFGLAGKVRW